MEEKAIEPLLIAIKAEKKAIDYYARAEKRITNPTGKEALRKIRLQEERHYKSLKNKFKRITGRDHHPDDDAKIQTALSSLTEEHLADKEASDLEVCQIAIKDEKEAHDFYSRSARSASDESARKLYHELAEEENNHQEVLKGLCRILSAR